MQSRARVMCYACTLPRLIETQRSRRATFRHPSFLSPAPPLPPPTFTLYKSTPMTCIFLEIIPEKQKEKPTPGQKGLVCPGVVARSKRGLYCYYILTQRYRYFSVESINAHINPISAHYGWNMHLFLLGWNVNHSHLLLWHRSAEAEQTDFDLNFYVWDFQ